MNSTNEVNLNPQTRFLLCIRIGTHRNQSERSDPVAGSQVTQSGLHPDPIQ